MKRGVRLGSPFCCSCWAGGDLHELVWRYQMGFVVGGNMRSQEGSGTLPNAMPWRESAGVTEAELPGRMVRGGRVKEGLTQAQLAALVGIPQRHVSEMEHNKRPIGKEMAKRLGKALGVSYKVFL